MTSNIFSELSAVTPRTDPTWEETKRRLWAMTPDERRAAMYAGTLSFKLCLHWASQTPHEVPTLNDEFWFIAIATPEIADATQLAASTTRPHQGTPPCRA